ncbi:MAG: glycerophosphodiester phosphodiesterase [Sphaerochaetaceae bacterium]|nr:glycerophosphodiester phosphodiesterase [Sphaerochaetaceae bacterium]
MKVLAHRGFSGKYPENTMLAFQKALEAGADGVELDVHESSDGQLVVIHDELLVRTTGREGSVSDFTLKELTGIKASKTMEDRFDACIPSFEEYCDFASKNRMLTNIEIKTNRSWYRAIEKKTVEMVHAFHLEDRVIFSSFNWLSVVRVNELAPEIPCGLLYEGQQAVRHLAYQAKDLGLRYLHPDFTLLDDEAVAECGATGVGLNVWTVNDRERMSKLMEWKVDGVISNYPDMCLQMLGRG